MFNDDYGLTQAVLDGRKTMTRRIIKCPRTFRGEWVAGFNVHIRQSDKKIVDYPCMYDADGREFDEGEILPKYKIGEVVAIAQSYETIYHEKGLETLDMLVSNWKNSKGWRNKMFVRSDLMPHHIRITNIKIERLQGISDEDCLKEGIYRLDSANGNGGIAYSFVGASEEKNIGLYPSPREAFITLIDKVSGKGIWERNPFVWVYEFELID